MARLVLANQATAAKRRVYFDCRDVTDGITAETGEAGGQPQVSSDGGAWTNTGIGTLTAIGNGRYYADLTQTLVATAGTVIETRYKSANTAETPGDSVQVVAFDPDDANALGLGSLDGNTPQTGDAFARLGAPAGASVSADVAALKVDTAAILIDTNELQADWTNGGRLDLLIDAILEDTGTTLPASLATVAGYLDTEIAAILADTSELQTDWANGGRLDLLLDTAAAGGAGLTAQQVRDAMKLAPTAGTPATGSVDKHLDDIQVVTDLIDPERVEYVSDTDAAGTITHTRGDTETATRSILNYAGPAIGVGTVAKFSIGPNPKGRDALITVNATAVMDGSTLVLSAPLTAAQTAALDPARTYLYDFQLTTSGVVNTPATGYYRVRADVTP